MNAFPLTLSFLVVPSLNCTANTNAAKKKRHVSVYCVRWMRFHALFGREHYFSSLFNVVRSLFQLCIRACRLSFVKCLPQIFQCMFFFFFSPLGFQNSVITFKDLM